MDSRVVLKGFFVTGAKPTQAQFADLIDSCLNLVDDTITVAQVEDLQTLLDAINATLEGLSEGTVPTPIANATGAELSKAALNAAYPTALNGQYVLCAAISTKYLKLDNSPTGNWDMQPYNPVA